MKLETPVATLQRLTEKIEQAVSEAGLTASIKIDLKGEGVIHIDGLRVSNEDRPADLTVTVSRADLMAIGKRQLDPTRAIMTGRMRLSDIGLAMRLQPAIQALFARTV